MHEKNASTALNNIRVTSNNDLAKVYWFTAIYSHKADYENIFALTNVRCVWTIELNFFATFLAIHVEVKL